MRILALISLTAWSVGCADDVPSAETDGTGTTGPVDATSTATPMSTIGSSSGNGTAGDSGTTSGATSTDTSADGTETDTSTGETETGETTDDGGSSSSGDAGSTSTGATGTTDSGTTDTGSGEGGSDTGMLCLPDDNGASIGTDCGPGGVMCLECYTCQPFVGFVFQQTCQILCDPDNDDADCPGDLTCNMTVDKTGIPWHQCA